MNNLKEQIQAQRDRMMTAYAEAKIEGQKENEARQKREKAEREAEEAKGIIAGIEFTLQNIQVTQTTNESGKNKNSTKHLKKK